MTHSVRQYRAWVKVSNPYTGNWHVVMGQPHEDRDDAESERQEIVGMNERHCESKIQVRLVTEWSDT